jgi:hypothetical protein
MGNDPAFSECSTMGNRNDTSVITYALALGVGACGPAERDNDPFGDGSFDDTSANPGASASDPSGDGTSGETATGTVDGDEDGDDDVKFDLGAPEDLPVHTGDGCKYLDMLFVVDISGSMNDVKENLNQNFPAFVEVLDDYIADPTNGALGYRLGATNSSFQSDGSTTGLDGALVNSGGAFGQPITDCGTGGEYWLDGPAPNISENFACLATNPRACTNTCSDLGVERPLDAMMGFVDKHAPGDVNEGFYRGAESLLIIVTLTDEDDQSMVSPAGAKAQLDTFTQGEDRYAIVTVTGPENTGCSSAFGSATSAPRLHEFSNIVNHGMVGDICQGDLTEALQDALELITFSCDTLPPPAG